MSATQNRLSQLFHKYYAGTAEDHEINEMMGLIRKAGGDDALSASMQEAWEELKTDKTVLSDEVREQMLVNILRPENAGKGESDSEEERYPAVRSNVFRWRYWAAAVIVLCSFTALWKWSSDKKGDAVAGQADIRPGGNRATLTLADGSVISLDATATGAVIQQGTAKISKAHEGELVYQQQGEAPAGSAPQLNTIATPRGGQYQINLPDGTRVWLNASSSIRFPVAFSATERRVEVQGEVYFQVQKDKLRPFRVNFGTNEVEVLGTSFNIMNYNDENAAQTTLEEGSLIVRSGTRESKLIPGEQASITGTGQLDVAKVDVDEAIAWKNGMFYFQDAGIQEVMRQAARWYDIEVHYEGQVPKRQFTGNVARNVNISELMGMLQYAGVNSRIEGRKITIIK